MKRAFSLSEMSEALQDGGQMQTMRRSKSQENMQRIRSQSNLNVQPALSVNAGSSRLPMLSEKELREHFNMPLNEVAKKYGMCTTALKKLCRKYGVMQWPHRKLRSLEKKIASLRAEQRYTTDGQGHLDDEIRKLEVHRELLVTGNDDGAELPLSPGDEEEEVETPKASSGGGGRGGEMRKTSSQDHMDRTLARGGGGSGGGGGGESGTMSRGGGGGGGRGNSNMDAQVQKQIQNLEEENTSLRSLTKSLMKERQELLKQASASNGEISKLRRLSEQLQKQVSTLKTDREGGSTAVIGQGTGRQEWEQQQQGEVGIIGVKGGGGQPIGGGSGMIWAATGMDAGVGLASGGPGPVGGWGAHQGGGGGEGGGGDAGGDLSQLSWMAPEFDLDDLL